MRDDYDMPNSFQREIKDLYEIGLEDYEIDYIKYLKKKSKAREKWKWFLIY